MLSPTSLNKTFIYLILVSSCFLLHCSRDPEPHCLGTSALPKVNEDLLTEDIRSFFWFEMGTYWTYTDSQQSSQTIRVINTVFSVSGDDTWSKCPGNYMPSSILVNGSMGIRISATEDERLTIAWPYEGGPRYGSYNGGELGGNFSFQEFNAEAISDSLTVVAGSFEDVKKYHSLSISSTNDTTEINYYYAPNVGLVKHENLRTGEVWELSEYNIVQ